MLLSGRYDGQGVLLPGQYNKHAYLPSVSDSFALRIKSLLSSGLAVGGRGDSLAMRKAAQSDTDLCIQTMFENLCSCPKVIKGWAGASISATTVTDSFKRVDADSGLSVVEITSPTLCWCTSGADGIAITAVAACTQFRVRQLGDLAGDTFADISSASLQEFYYVPCVPSLG